MVRASEGGWSRYTASKFGRDNQGGVGPWTLATPHFAGAHVGGSSGPAFLPLPNPGLGPGKPTHLISNGSRGTYSVGTTTPGDESFRVTGTFDLDYGDLGWTAAGIDQAT
jgi:hypothetical protein